MSDKKCCCNCLHCARWQTSKGVECHCDLDDKYLGYLTVMNTDIDCCKWEKETKWELQEKHDKEIYNKAIDDFCADMLKKIEFEDKWLFDCKSNNADTNIMISALKTFCKEIAELLKGSDIN